MAERDAPPQPRLLFVVAEDWYFCSHRLHIALAARDAGFDVVVATRVRAEGGDAARITAAGLRLHPIGMSRGRLNPWRELLSVLELLRVYRRERPDLVHHVAVKPVIYGSLAARLAGVPRVVNALAGLGFLFSSISLKARLLRPLATLAYRLLLGGPKQVLILQNADDRELFVRRGLVSAAATRLIRGSGVDTDRYAPRPEPDGPPLVALPARLLRDKGVAEFVAAARLLKTGGVAARFALIGDVDPENPASIGREQLAAWQAEGVVEVWGHRDDMPEVLAGCALVCLPSYREGLPKILLEAASCGRAIVATDVPGCREIVVDGDNGLLVPPRDAPALAAALATLLGDPALRRSMGERGRQRVLAEFAAERVAAATLAVYRELLAA
jgi:glycosyltransferase involved in cell wall biosynthesis